MSDGRDKKMKRHAQRHFAKKREERASEIRREKAGQGKMVKGDEKFLSHSVKEKSIKKEGSNIEDAKYREVKKKAPSRVYNKAAKRSRVLKSIGKKVAKGVARGVLGGAVTAASIMADSTPVGRDIPNLPKDHPAKIKHDKETLSLEKKKSDIKRKQRLVKRTGWKSDIEELKGR